MKSLLDQTCQELQKKRLLRPVIVSTSQERIFAAELAAALPNSQYAPNQVVSLMGRDVILVHAGEYGWDEALEMACRDCPSRLFVVARDCPRETSLKLEWVADVAFVGHETYQYEVHELGLSA